MIFAVVPAVPLAHTGHWYHSLLYALPIVIIALAMWWSGRRDRSREDRDREDGGEAGSDRGGSPSES